MKTCTKCKIEKEDSGFYKHAKSKDGLMSSCKACNDESKKNYLKTEIGSKKNKEWYLNNSIKPEVKREKSLYNKQYRENNPEKIKKNNEKNRKNRADWYQENGKTPDAKKIRGEKVNQWRKDNPEQWRNIDRKYSLMKKFGMTLEEYNIRLIAQDNKCAICGKEETRRHQNGTLCFLSVDHDHLTGENRDLLCSKCNLGLGHYDDNPILFTKAGEYLTKWNLKQNDIIKNITN